MDEEQALAILKDHLQEEHLALEGREGMALPKDDEYRFIYGPSRSLEELESLHNWDHGEGSTDHSH